MEAPRQWPADARTALLRGVCRETLLCPGTDISTPPPRPRSGSETERKAEVAALPNRWQQQVQVPLPRHLHSARPVSTGSHAASTVRACEHRELE